MTKALRHRHELKGNYVKLLDLLSREEQLLREHFLTNLKFKRSSWDGIENDSISCVTEAADIQIRNELERAEFVSIQVDETTDVGCKFQISIIFRYVLDSSIEERFIGFFDMAKDKTVTGLSSVLLE